MIRASGSAPWAPNKGYRIYESEYLVGSGCAPYKKLIKHGLWAHSRAPLQDGVEDGVVGDGIGAGTK